MSRAAVGDRVHVRSRHLDERVREGEVLEVRGSDGGPPWRVRWSDDGHESLVFPGGDTTVEHVVPAAEQEAPSRPD